MYADVAFVLNEILPKHTVRGRLGDAFPGDREIREGMLVSDPLVEAVLYSENPLLNVSPLLLFSVLVSRVCNEFSSRSSTSEVSGRHTAAFDVGETLQLVAKPQVFDYLILLRDFFVHARVITLTVADGSGFRRPLKIDPLDLDRIVHAAVMVEEPEKLISYQCVADLCLFTIGILPERLRATGGRRVAAVHAECFDNGLHFYQLASLHQTAQEQQVDSVLSELGATSILRRSP